MKTLWIAECARRATNTAQLWKSICRAALLNDKAPDSEFYRHGFESTREAAIFDFYNRLYNFSVKFIIKDKK